MPTTHNHEHFDLEELDSPENDAQKTQERAEPKPEEIDQSVTELPDGGKLYNVRFSDENGEQNVISVQISEEGKEEVRINGMETSDPEEVSKVNELLEINQATDAEKEPSNDNENHTLENQSNETTDEVRRELQAQGADLSDEEMVERRTDELANKTLEQPGADRARDEDEEGVKRAMLAEQLMDKNQEIAHALADALREAGDASGAQQLQQLAFDAGRRVGGVKAVENEDNVLQEFGKKAEEAMSKTGKTVEELEDDAEEDERKAA